MSPFGKKLRAKAKGELRRRAAIIGEVVRILDCGRSSKFEYEASCRHGLRSGLCLQGEAWSAADKFAGEVVMEALRRLGAERPSWAQGQPEHTQFGFAPVERFFCERCGNLIPDDRVPTGGNAVRFCSHECYQLAKVNRHARMRRMMTAAERAAMAAANAEARRHARDEAMTKVCEHCGTAFRAKESARRFCSHSCATASTRKPQPPKRTSVIAERVCRACSKTFQTARPDRVYCSDRCKTNYQRAALAARLPAQQCAACGITFQPDRSGVKFCSPACAQQAKRVVRQTVPCATCGQSFELPRRGVRFCSDACSRIARRGRLLKRNGFTCESVEA